MNHDNSNEYQERLRVEAEHYFQAELAHDQRASWILTLATALVVFSFSWHTRDPALGTLDAVAIAFSVFSLGVALISVLPIWGAHGHLVPFRRREARPSDQRNPDLEWLARHYLAHKTRATKKALLVCSSVVTLMFSVVISTIAIIA